MSEMPKAYEPQLVEDAIYKQWLESGYFTPENLPDADQRTEAFSMVLPPPNVTGTLHMGHATMLAIEDAMVRFARLRGKKALWIPGTDHAAIATQSKVEGMIMKQEGKSRHDLGREAFLDRVREFAQASHDTIVNQCKKMGSSLDWSREAYTLDDARNKAVNVAFKRMYDDGLIYRGYRVVNWDPIGQTTIADDEIVYKETTAKLYTFKYGVDFPIAISTTRPETKVGDTAVAVHPDDTRYQEFIGKTFDVEFAGAKLSIRVVADESVDPGFGTGALGVTPAHSVIDADIAKRHDLPMIQVIGEDAVMLPVAGDVAGMSTKDARAKVVEWLRENSLLIDEQEAQQSLSTAERTGGVIEPLPKMQWFVDVNKTFARDGKQVTLKSLMQDAVRAKSVEIIPERFEKTYFHWIDNLRDWNISRQIWFGHRVPVWYCKNVKPSGEKGCSYEAGMNVIVSVDIATKCPECGGLNLVQDSDTLDTWFSSGLWTFSTLGWPNQDASDLKTFHPTSVLETGYDILFFWVARMILMSTYLVNEVPFKTVYLHGLVRDEQGRKMSKSLGNIIDPLDMITKYGADATRLSLVIGATPGNDVKLSEEKIAGFRNFTNKLWNISRFVLMQTGELKHVESVEPKTLTDRWILARFSEVVAKVSKLHESYDLSLAGEVLRDFTWNEFADWYLEIAKVEKDKDDILNYILERLLIMWHPFMPFVTEEIYKNFNVGMLMVAKWPEVLLSEDKEVFSEFDRVREIITAIRNLRAQYKIEPKKTITISLVNAEEMKKHVEIIAALSRAELAFNEAEGAKAVVGAMTVVMPLEGLVDAVKEKARLEKELASVSGYVTGLEKKLENAEFVKNAPAVVVEQEQKKLSDAKEKLAAIMRELASLS